MKWLGCAHESVQVVQLPKLSQVCGKAWGREAKAHRSPHVATRSQGAHSQRRRWDVLRVDRVSIVITDGPCYCCERGTMRMLAMPDRKWWWSQTEDVLVPECLPIPTCDLCGECTLDGRQVEALDSAVKVKR